MRTIVLMVTGLLLAGCTSREYPGADQGNGLFMVGDRWCFRGARGDLCGSPELPPDNLVLATCERVARAQAEGRTVDNGSERLAQQGRAAGVCEG